MSDLVIERHCEHSRCCIALRSEQKYKKRWIYWRYAIAASFTRRLLNQEHNATRVDHRNSLCMWRGNECLKHAQQKHHSVRVLEKHTLHSRLPVLPKPHDMQSHVRPCEQGWLHSCLSSFCCLGGKSAMTWGSPSQLQKGKTRQAQSSVKIKQIKT